MDKKEFISILNKFSYDRPITMVYYDMFGDKYYLKVARIFKGNMKTELITEYELSDTLVEYSLERLLKTYDEDTTNDAYFAFQTQDYEDIFIEKFDIENSILTFR